MAIKIDFSGTGLENPADSAKVPPLNFAGTGLESPAVPTTQTPDPTVTDSTGDTPTPTFDPAQIDRLISGISQIDPNSPEAVAGREALKRSFEKGNPAQAQMLDKLTLQGAVTPEQANIIAQRGPTEFPQVVASEVMATIPEIKNPLSLPQFLGNKVFEGVAGAFPFASSEIDKAVNRVAEARGVQPSSVRQEVLADLRNITEDTVKENIPLAAATAVSVLAPEVGFFAQIVQQSIAAGAGEASVQAVDLGEKMFSNMTNGEPLLSGVEDMTPIQNVAISGTIGGGSAVVGGGLGLIFKGIGALASKLGSVFKTSFQGPNETLRTILANLVDATNKGTVKEAIKELENLQTELGNSHPLSMPIDAFSSRGQLRDLAVIVRGNPQGFQKFVEGFAGTQATFQKKLAKLTELPSMNEVPSTEIVGNILTRKANTFSEQITKIFKSPTGDEAIDVVQRNIGKSLVDGHATILGSFTEKANHLYNPVDIAVAKNVGFVGPNNELVIKPIVKTEEIVTRLRNFLPQERDNVIRVSKGVQRKAKVFDELYTLGRDIPTGKQKVLRDLPTTNSLLSLVSEIQKTGGFKIVPQNLKKTIGEFAQIPEKLTFSEAQKIKSALFHRKEALRMLNVKDDAIRPLSTLIKSFDTAMEKAIKPFSKIKGGGLSQKELKSLGASGSGKPFELWRKADAFWRDGAEIHSNQELIDLMKGSEGTIGKTLLQGDANTWATIEKLASTQPDGNAIMQDIQASYMDVLLDKATENNVLNVGAFRQLFSKTKAAGKVDPKNFLTPDQQEVFRNVLSKRSDIVKLVGEIQSRVSLQAIGELFTKTQDLPTFKTLFNISKDTTLGGKGNQLNITKAYLRNLYTQKSVLKNILAEKKFPKNVPNITFKDPATGKISSIRVTEAIDPQRLGKVIADEREKLKFLATTSPEAKKLVKNFIASAKLLEQITPEDTLGFLGVMWDSQIAKGSMNAITQASFNLLKGNVGQAAATATQGLANAYIKLVGPGALAQIIQDPKTLKVFLKLKKLRDFGNTTAFEEGSKKLAAKILPLTLQAMGIKFKGEIGNSIIEKSNAFTDTLNRVIQKSQEDSSVNF